MRPRGQRGPGREGVGRREAGRRARGGRGCTGRGAGREPGGGRQPSAPAGRAARQLPGVGGAERRRRGEGTGGGRRGSGRGGAGPLVSAAPRLSPPGEEERGQPPPPPPPSQPLRAPELAGRLGSPRCALCPGRPARAQPASVSRWGASPGPPPALPRLAWPRLCVRRPQLPGSSAAPARHPSSPTTRALSPGAPGRASSTVDRAAARRRVAAPASSSLGPRPRPRPRHGCEVLPRGGRGPRWPGLRAVPGVLRLQQGDRAGGGGHLSIPGASRLARCTFFSIFSPRTLVSWCAFVSDQLSSSSLSVSFPPTFFVPLLALPLPSWSPPPLPPKLCEAQSRH